MAIPIIMVITTIIVLININVIVLIALTCIGNLDAHRMFQNIQLIDIYE